jgi:hypothetical protein
VPVVVVVAIAVHTHIPLIGLPAFRYETIDLLTNSRKHYEIWDNGKAAVMPPERENIVVDLKNIL